MESGFETAWGLARGGKATKAGLPKNPLQLVVLASEHKDEVYLTSPPIPVQKAFFAILDLLAPVGRLLGYRASYQQYGASEQHTGSGNEGLSAAPRLRGVVVKATVLAIFAALFLLRRLSRLRRR
ncbi:MAG TPA: hypothetical protein VFI90_10885 [Rubrobacter sp.]|nr:hypothetical protein [Rubrobacter sp.]